jgi:DNA repair exonuclease SbcCD nuclease subunit
MKVLFCGDKHLKINRFDLAKQCLSWLNTTIEHHKPDLYVCLGDDLDTHSIIRSEILTELRYHFDYVLSLGIPIVYVVGNHDCSRPNDMKYHALQSMIGLNPNLHIIDKPQDLKGMTFVPYVHKPEDFPKQSLPICVAHQTFKGADFGDITTKDGVDASSVIGAEIIVSGHIHKRQRMDASSIGGPEVIYCGSPFSQSSSDINQIKGVSIIDTQTFVEEFITCPLPMWRGIKYELSQTFSIEEMHEDLMHQLNDIDHWVIELTGPKAEILSYLSSKNVKSITTGRDVKIKTIFTDKEKKQLRIEATSLSSIIPQYIDKVYSGSIDKEILKSTASEFYKSLNNSSRLV